MLIDRLFPKSRGQVSPSGLGPSDAGTLFYADGVKWNPLGTGVAQWVMWTGTAWAPLPAASPTYTGLTVSSGIIANGGITGAAGTSSTLPKLNLVFDTGALANSTSVTTNGVVTLDGATHGGYLMEAIIINAAGVNCDYRLWLNNDTTDANYSQWGIHWGGASANETPVADARIFVGASSAAATWFHLYGDLAQGPDGRVSLYTRITYTQVGVADYGFSRNWFHNNTVTNTTRLDWVASATNGIGANSRIRLWRRT